MIAFYTALCHPSDSAILQSDLHLIKTWCETWLMRLNVKKTVLISFHRKQSHQTFTYSICGSAILSVSSYKHLGINLASDLSWSSHILHISNNANRALGYIRRNLKLAPPSLKIQAYITLVRPKLEYACAIWDPFQSNHTYTLEAVQNRAIRFIYSDYSHHTSVSALKRRANLKTLASRRKTSHLCLFHKFYHALPPSSAITPTHRTSCRTSHAKAVYPPAARTSAHLHSFFVQTAKDWNSLPTDAIQHSDPTKFKDFIDHLIN